MSAEFRVWLPFPPSTNNLFTQGRVHGVIRRFPTPQYLKWKKQAVRAIFYARPPKFPERVTITLALTARDNRRRDCSNYIKAVEDALVEGKVIAGDDQHYVWAATAYWLPPDAKTTGVNVVVRPALDTSPQKEGWGACINAV